MYFQFLIGYNRGLIVLWDNKASNSEQTYNSTQVFNIQIVKEKYMTIQINKNLLITV